VTVFCLVYLAACSACLGWLRLWAPESMGVPLVLLFLATIWLGDSGAYYVGKSLGRHRMSPRVSPKKTWEGLAGGVLASIATVCVGRALTLETLPWVDALAIGGIIGVTGPIGDLVESLFKRDTGVKDSSSLFPGHGGMLDRTDSILYAAPWVVAYLTFRGVLQ
jgi:phosphatidate cytidylyltransferase